MNHLRSCVTPGVKIVWWNRCKRYKPILDFDLELSPMMLQIIRIYHFRLGDHFSFLKLGANPCFPSYYTMITTHIETIDD